LAAEDTQPSIEELMARQGGRLRRFLRGRVRNSADIPDLIQEIFLRLLRVPRRETIRLPEAYLFTIARHTVQQHELTKAGERLVELDSASCEFLAGPDPDPVLEVAADECLAVLEHALDEMPPKLRATFLLHRRDGLSLEAIGVRLGISLPMVKKHLMNALAQLRERLKESGVGTGL
jgi:RNA polymerase sigma factor (sigma-70 family)